MRALPAARQASSFRSWKALWISILVLVVTTAILKFNWFDKLDKESAAAA